MLGLGGLGQFALGQVGPVEPDPPTPGNGVRLPLYTQATYTYPARPANYWKGTTNGQ